MIISGELQIEGKETRRDVKVFKTSSNYFERDLCEDKCHVVRQKL